MWFGAELFAQLAAPAAKPHAAAPLTAKDIHVFPFAREFKEQKFKSSSRDLPDELHVNIGTASIHLYGKKRTDALRVQGRPTGHVGKAVLLPASDRSGTVVAKVPSAEEVTSYFAVIELADSLDTKPLKLDQGKTYNWTVKSENGTTTFKVTDGATELAAFSNPTDSVEAVGFAATVRNIGNEADMTIATP